jgi:hypothetical protein
MEESGADAAKRIRESDFALYLERYRTSGHPLIEEHEFALMLLEFLARTARGSARRWLRRVSKRDRESMAMYLSHHGYLGLALAALGVPGQWHLQAGLPPRPLNARMSRHRQLARSGALSRQETKSFWALEVWELITKENSYLRALFPLRKRRVTVLG